MQTSANGTAVADTTTPAATPVTTGASDVTGVIANEGVQVGTLKITNNGGELPLVRSLTGIDGRVLHSSIRMMNVTCFDAAASGPFAGSSECSTVAAALTDLGYVRQTTDVINCPCGQRMILAGLANESAWHSLHAQRAERAKAQAALRTRVQRRKEKAWKAMWRCVVRNGGRVGTLN